jgi:2-phospho-L-lactate guanylyltransferase
MAERVLAAAAPLPVVVACDDRGVADWAEALGASVEWTPGVGLNGAVQQGFASLADAGFDVVVVAHADLPHAAGLDRVAVFPDDVVLVPDRHDDGTNVLAVPTSAAGFTFAYGVGSFARHVAEAERLGRRARVERLPELQWDVDTPDDLPVNTTT